MAVIATYRNLSGWVRNSVLVAGGAGSQHSVFNAVDPAIWPNGAVPAKFVSLMRYDVVGCGTDDSYHSAFQVYQAYRLDAGVLTTIGTSTVVGYYNQDIDSISAGRTGLSFRLGLRSSSYSMYMTVAPTLELVSVHD